ncbi:MAG: PorV/PorQ family protein [Melioribacteraceae bacterium]|nr:PorV/PorQ family protein [Melioribacteraceae bacterium]
MNIKNIIIGFVMIGFFTAGSFAQTKKLAQTGMKFLNVSTNAQVAGISGAITSLHGGSASMLYNPAGMAEIPTMVDVSVNTTQWIADINHLSATVAVQPFDNYYGVLGISVVAVDYGEFMETVRSTNDKGYLDLGTYSPSAIAIGIGYARSLSQKFAIGGNVKYIRQSLIGDGKVGLTTDGYETEKFETSVFAFDFGLIYKTGFESLNIGMSVRNFSEEIKFIEEGFQLPLIFQIGMSFDLIDVLPFNKENHSLIIALDANHPRDFSEQIIIGAEYTFINTFSIRTGFNSPNDDAGFNAGFGIKRSLAGVFMSVDYAYEPHTIFDDVHRFSVRIAY